jgi:hypothetical protein
MERHADELMTKRVAKLLLHTLLNVFREESEVMNYVGRDFVVLLEILLIKINLTHLKANITVTVLSEGRSRATERPS